VAVPDDSDGGPWISLCGLRSARHGRSSQPGGGYDSDTLADDLATVIERLDLHDVTLVGHSMAGGEIVRYLSRHGAGRVSRIVLIAPTTPFILQTADNPHGVAEAYIDQARAQWSRDFSKWLVDNSRPFFVPETSQEMMDWVGSLMRQASLKAVLDCNYSMAHTDFRPDLAKVTVPALIIQGDKDASAPLELTGRPDCGVDRWKPSQGL
jgi:non-heme chloroperoxidase